MGWSTQHFLQNWMCPSEDSVQPVHPASLIRVVTVNLKMLWVIGYPVSTLQRLCSVCPRWAHVSCRKCCVRLIHQRRAESRPDCADFKVSTFRFCSRNIEIIFDITIIWTRYQFFLLYPSVNATFIQSRCNIMTLMRHCINVLYPLEYIRTGNKTMTGVNLSENPYFFVQTCYL